jgi:hypothetical protein
MRSEGHGSSDLILFMPYPANKPITSPGIDFDACYIQATTCSDCV